MLVSGKQPEKEAASFLDEAVSAKKNKQRSFEGFKKTGGRILMIGEKDNLAPAQEGRSGLRGGGGRHAKSKRCDQTKVRKRWRRPVGGKKQ